MIGTAGTPRKRELLNALGVAHVFDSRSLRFSDQIRAITDDRGVDLVLNAWVDVSGNDFHPAGGTQTPAPAV